MNNSTSVRQVRYLKIIEKSGYQALPWVRYITQSGGESFSRRVTSLKCHQTKSNWFLSAAIPTVPVRSRTILFFTLSKRVLFEPLFHDRVCQNNTVASIKSKTCLLHHNCCCVFVQSPTPITIVSLLNVMSSLCERYRCGSLRDTLQSVPYE